MDEDFILCKKMIEGVSNIFAGKWTFLLLGELHDGPRRFNQLNKAMNISTKSLTDTLKHLEKHGIIKRSAYATVPVTVEYSLTPKGKDFDQVLLYMNIWAEKWIADELSNP